ncbi:MAG: NAD-dependent epimerase/dehydratase family protein [Rhizobiaceae bacterium]
MTTIAVLGANGRVSRTVAKAFLEAGNDVIAVTRSGKPLGELAGARFIAADAMNAKELIQATRGADIIFNGLNPLYTEWEEKVLPMARNVMEACRANGAMHLFSGNVYGYGSPMPLELGEDTPMRPSTAKGRIRIEMERIFKEESERPGGVQTVVLRAGDYFGGTGAGSFFDLVSVSKLAKGIFTAAGPENLIHEWAYLPDFARAFVKLADNRAKLAQFENLNFPSHAMTELQLKAAVEKAVGKPLKLAHLPWMLIRLMGIVMPMMRELSRMSYLRLEPHRLVSTRLESLIGPIPHTPLDEAVRQALIDQGLLQDGIKRAA